MADLRDRQAERGVFTAEEFVENTLNKLRTGKADLRPLRNLNTVQCGPREHAAAVDAGVAARRIPATKHQAIFPRDAATMREDKTVASVHLTLSAVIPPVWGHAVDDRRGPTGVIQHVPE